MLSVSSANKALLDACLNGVTAALHVEHPDVGRDVAIDGSDLPAYANGQRFLSKNGPERERHSDPDASWGHRSAVSTRKGGGFYSYKVHAAVCAVTGLPVSWTVETASAAETSLPLPLIDAARGRGFKVKNAIADKCYDNGPFHDGCMERDISPITPLRQTPAVWRGDHKPPCCEHGTWTFAGADFKRRATKWRWPTGECQPASTWVKADRLHQLIPRESKRSRALYASRGSVEREFRRLKHEWALLLLRVRGLDRVRLHADLTILAKLACALVQARTISAPLGQGGARRWWSGGSSLRQTGQVPCQQARSACSSRTTPNRVRLPPWLAGGVVAPGSGTRARRRPG